MSRSCYRYCSCCCLGGGDHASGLPLPSVIARQRCVSFALTNEWTLAWQILRSGDAHFLFPETPYSVKPFFFLPRGRKVRFGNHGETLPSAWIVWDFQHFQPKSRPLFRPHKNWPNGRIIRWHCYGHRVEEGVSHPCEGRP